MEMGTQKEVLNKRRKQETDPLKMGHILEKVFGFLDAESVKAARQVNPLWSIEGAKMLITKCYVNIPPEIQAGDSSPRNITMEKFKLFLSHKSKDFPVIPNIIVATIGNVGQWKSLGVLGQQVKSLKCTFMDSQAKLLSKLLNVLPNLKYLDFRGVKASKYISNIIISTMSKKERNGSPLVISSMALEPNNEELAVMEKLSDCKNIMIEEIEFKLEPFGFTPVPNFEVRISNIINKLLSTSQNVLKKLTLHSCEHFLPLLEFPCMTKLTTITFTLYTRTALLPGCKFAPSFRFSEKLPNLQEICIYDFTDSTDFLQNLLENTGTAPSVKRVNCFRSPRDEGIDQLFKTFPNIEELELLVNGNSESKFRSLWTLGKNLKKLRLFIDWSPDMGNFPDLDYLFTGFEAETVKKIKETPNLDLFTLEELEKLRVNPGISNLKELEQLVIHFLFSLAADVPDRMLTVTAKYEISQLPKKPWILVSSKNTCGFRRTFEEVSKLPNFFLLARKQQR